MRPTQHLKALGAGIALLAMLPACSGEKSPPKLPPPDGGKETPMDAGVDSGPMVMQPVCDPETNKFCAGSDASIPEGCGGEDFDLTPNGVQVMFLIDGSHSMAVNWFTVAEALKASMEAYTDISYGLHLFYADTDGWGFFQDGNLCGEERNVVLDVSPDNGQNVFDTLGPTPPGPGNRIIDTSPVVQALNYYVENDSELTNPDTTNYLVLVSDINDNCFGTFLASDDDKNAAFAKIGVELQKRNIRLIPIGFDAATGMRDFRGDVQTDRAALETLTEFGGAALQEAIAADNPEELQDAILNIGSLVTPCRFTIPATLDPSSGVNAFELNFYLNNVEVERDRTNEKGWNFVNSNTSEVEFREQACEAIRGGATLEARKGCSEDAVCGTSTTKLQTKRRAIQFAVDTSLSMAASDDALGVFLGTERTYWGEAVSAISDALVLPANDDADMGLQLFPQGILDCNVATTPEVPPGEGTEIEIIERLLSHAPVGQTPLIQVMETTAENPGRLGDDDTSGALIVISDGAHAPSCGNITGLDEDDDGVEDVTADEVAVRRLGAASMQLHDETGTLVYAVKFGADPEDNTSATAAQLTAIAENGGTETFRVAATGDELTKVLEEISDELATCEIEVDLDAPDADPEKLNIYLNGRAVAQDPAREQGWFWVDEDSKESIELHGDDCTELKTGRLTNLAVEFGCDPIIIL